MLAILATVVLVAVNPLRQFAQARNTQRQANVSAILNAVGNRIADNRGIFGTSADGCALPTTAGVVISDDGTASNVDLRPCLVPTYISELPFDPLGGTYGNTCSNAECTNGSYNTGYTIQEVDSRVTVCAPKSKESALGPVQSQEEFCLTR